MVKQSLPDCSPLATSLIQTHKILEWIRNDENNSAKSSSEPNRAVAFENNATRKWRIAIQHSKI